MSVKGTRRSPDGALALEWVFGYNGHTARNNVKINAKGHLVYYVAGVGVVHDTKEQSQRFFTGHSDDITSLALNSEKRLAATGQVGDDAYIAVWDAITCAPLSVIHDAHSFQVISIAFSLDSKQLASVGGAESKMELVVWDWQKGRKLGRQVAHTGKVEEVEFDASDSSKLVTCGENHVKFWKLRGNVLQATAGAFGEAATERQVSITFLGKDKIVSGSTGGHLLVWTSGRVSKVIKDVHKGGVTALEAFRGGIISAGHSGNIRIYDKNLREIAAMNDTTSIAYNKQGPIQSLFVYGNTIVFGTQYNEIWMLQWGEDNYITGEVVVQGHGVGEVWGLATHPSLPVALTGSDDGTIRLWSLKDYRMITSSLIEEEVRSVAFNPSGTHVAIGLLHGSFIILDSESLKELYRISDRNEARHDIRYSPDGKILAVASNDNFIDLYKVEKKYEKIRAIGGASSFITHLDWSTDSKYIQLNSGAGERLIFKIEGMVDFLPKGLQWASWTCVLGKEVKGIWAKYTDLSDVNAVDASFCYNVMVTGDDFGIVKLFRFPCPKRGSKPRNFVGHSAHVTNVRWTSDCSHVVSVGGADHAVFIWEFKQSRAMTDVMDTVSIREMDEDSDEDIMDTEDELEAIPEVTGELEEELTNIKNVSTKRTDGKPQIQDDSVFSKRCKSMDIYADIDEPPSQHLRIEHVFGYRSYDSRDNCHWLKDKCIVYHVAAVGIVCDTVTREQRHYLHHTDDISCLAVHPDGEIVATGQVGKKASIQVWSSTSLKILSFLGGGHDKGVVAISFSNDGERVASIGADDYHTVVVWKWITGRRIASVRNSAKKVFGVKFSPSNNSKLVTYGIRHIRVWTVVGSGMSWRQVTMGQNHKADTVLCCAGIARADGDRWALGMTSGLVLVINQSEILKSIKAHKGAIFSIYVPLEAESNSAWTGGKDGLLCEWDRAFQRCIKSYPISDHSLVPDSPVSLVATQSAVRSLSWCPNSLTPILIGTENSEILLMNQDGLISIVVQGHGKGEIWGLAAHPHLMEAVTVSDDRTLRRWVFGDEFRSIGYVHLRKAARCVHVHPKGYEIAVGFLDGSVALYTYPNLQRIGGAHDRQQKIADVKFSSDGRMLAVASHDSFVDLYVVDTDGDTISKKSSGLKRLGVCRDASSFISHVSWHSDSRLLQINSGAGEQLFYEAPKGTRLLIPEKSEDTLSWASPLTCPLDVTLSGVWQPRNDLSDINAVATSNNKELVATANDKDGLLKLFKYPCKGKMKRHRKYEAHSSHVTKVWWSCDDRYLLSCGGADTALIVWSVQTGPIEDDADDKNPLPSDLPEEDVTLTDLEVSGLTEVSPLPPVIDSKRLQFDENLSKEERFNSEQLLVALHKLRALPIIREDKQSSILFLHDNFVRYFEFKDAQVVDTKIAYDEHDTQVTAIALSKDPVWVATASTGIKEIKNVRGDKEKSLESVIPGEQGALVHIWHPLDSGTVTTLTTGDETNIVTGLSFSPDGRFLAILADASVIHVFNWVKVILISQASLKTGGVVAISYSTNTTIAALTPKALYLCDMVGNALLPMRTLIPPGLLPDPSIIFTSLVVDEVSCHALVGCSDASILEWSLRTAIRRSSNPKQAKAGKGEVTSHKTSYSKIRSIIASGNGTTYLIFRNGIELVVHLYATENLIFINEYKTGVPQPTWRPTSASLGKINLIIGGHKGEPFVILNLKRFSFHVLKADQIITKDVKRNVNINEKSKK